MILVKMSSSRILPPNVNYLKNVDWYRLNRTIKRHQPQPTPENLEILFKNKHFVVVNKPFDLVVYDFTRYRPATYTLMDLLREKFPFHFDPRLTGGFHVLHRLDAVTSGCMCVPLNYFSLKVAMEAFVEKKAEKYYLALVYGLVEPKHQPNSYGVRIDSEDTLTVNVPIGDNLNQFRYSRCTSVDPFGKPDPNCVNPQESGSMIKVLEYGTYKGQPASKVLLKALTGRRHQLRVHLKYIGHPVVGDMCYGLDDFETYRTMLHAYKFKLRIDTKERMFIKAKADDPFLPQVDSDWKPDRVLNQLESLKI